MAAMSALFLLMGVSSSSGFMHCEMGSLSGRSRVVVGAAATAAPRVVVDFDVLADTIPFESEVYLAALQSLRPSGPWASLEELPDHKWRTFDLSLKFSRVLAERKVVRPAEACTIRATRACFNGASTLFLATNVSMKSSTFREPEER